MADGNEKLTLNCVSLFSGIEAFSVAASRITDVNWNMVFFSEIDPFPCAVLEHHYPNVPNLGDICKIKADLEKGIITNGRTTIPVPRGGIDILAGGSPCFVAGTMVLTPTGYRPIEDLKVGDMVVGGSGAIRKVEAAGSRMAEVGVLKVLGRPQIVCTPDHPFYAVEMKRDNRRHSPTYANKIPVGGYGKVHAKDLVGKYVGRVSAKLPDNYNIAFPGFPKCGSATEEDIMELAGWYVGDGCLLKRDGKLTGILLSLCHNEKMEAFKKRFSGLFHISECSNEVHFAIYNSELAKWIFENFGEYSLYKKIPYWCYFHPHKDNFIKGYFATDGFNRGAEEAFVTVSPSLAYGLADLLGNAYVALVKVPPKTIIEGREVNQHNWYRITTTPKPIRTKFINGRYASIARSYGTTGTLQRVYNITVGDEHTYIVNGLWVSNCQDVSVAGKRAGMESGSGTRSSLAFEYSRLVEELRPRILLWENVFGVLSSNRGLDFLAFQHSLVKRGYGVCWRVLDAQYTRVAGFPRAIPQRRRRIFLVGVRTVGCSGVTPAGIAEILLERPSLLGSTPPCRETGKGFAAPVGYCVEGDDPMVGQPEGANANPNGNGRGAVGSGGGFRGGVGNNAVEAHSTPFVDISQTITARSYKGVGSRNGDISWAVGVCPLPNDVCPTIDAAYPGHLNKQDLGKFSVCPAEGYRGASFGNFEKTDVSGTLDRLHCPWVGNGTPCMAVMSNDADGKANNRSAGDKNSKSDCLNPEHPMTHRVYRTGGSYPTIMSGRNSGQDQRSILIEAGQEEVVAFAQNQREEVRDLGQAAGALPAEEGTHQRTMICCASSQPQSTTRGYGIEAAPTMGAAAGESGNNKPFVAIGGALENVTTYENHAQDSRVRQVDVMPTFGASEANSPGSTGNNPLVVSTVAIDQQGGKGMAATAEEVLPTIASDSHGTPHAVCTTNSNGEDVMPTISADEYKMTQHQKDRSGGYVMQTLF